MGVGGMHAPARRMAHQVHAHFLQYAGLHEPRVEGMSKIVKSQVTNARVSEGRRPRAFHDADGTSAKADDGSLGFAPFPEIVAEPVRERNLTRFTFGCFGARDRKHVPGEIDVLPKLVRDLTPAHAGVERHENHEVEVILRNAKEEFLFDE